MTFFLWKTARSCACLSLFKYKNPGAHEAGWAQRNWITDVILLRIGRQTKHSLISTAAGLSRNTALMVRLVPLLIRGQDRWYAVPVTGVRDRAKALHATRDRQHPSSPQGYIPGSRPLAASPKICCRRLTKTDWPCTRRASTCC